MDGRQYSVAKHSDTSADTLLAIGFASLLGDLHRMIYGSSAGISIRDAGSCYVITLPRPVTIEEVRQHVQEPLAPLLALVSSSQQEKEAKKGRTLAGFPFDAQMERSKDYYEQKRKLAPTDRRKADNELRDLIGEPPDSRLGYYQAINQMKVAGSFNEIVRRWDTLTLEQQHLAIDLLLTLFGQPENDIEAAAATWQKLTREQGLPGGAWVTALQVVNPTTGKGANSAKASRLDMGNQESFWLLELLKFQGWMDSAAPLLIRESKDRKTYVLQPRLIELRMLQDMMQAFRTVFFPSTAVKLDIMASLLFAQVLIKHLEQSLRTETQARTWQRRSISSIAQGFEVSFYKDLGSAYATMNIATINVPAWLPLPDTREQAQDALALLREHIGIVRQIRRNERGEEGAEEYELLRFYRDFLSGNDLRPFWKFTGAYSGYLISQREREKHPQRQINQLSTTVVEVLLQMHDTINDIKLAPILENAGFKRIADAIRMATVTAQYRRAQQKDRRYEVRYGLGQDLMRKARYPAEFMVTLSTFLHDYNAETAREEEKVATKLQRPLTVADRRAYKLRFPVSTEDIEEIATLIDRYTSELICSMLVAYGYARAPRAGNASAPDTSGDGDPDAGSTLDEEVDSTE
ncbi:MAG: hypothetical protein H0W02_18485 [Ktedonobacteraceae bacterium]|nr:hypothetical protein [Ktedonobacteraceae bacterium]